MSPEAINAMRCGVTPKAKGAVSSAFSGGAYRDRTGDLRLAKRAAPFAASRLRSPLRMDGYVCGRVCPTGSPPFATAVFRRLSSRGPPLGVVDVPKGRLEFEILEIEMLPKSSAAAAASPQVSVAGERPLGRRSIYLRCHRTSSTRTVPARAKAPPRHRLHAGLNRGAITVDARIVYERPR